MRRLRPLLSLAAALIVWDAASRLAGTRALPQVREIALAAFGLVASGTLPRSLGLTLAHTAAGLGLALAVGLPLGLWMGRSRTANALLAPTIGLVRPLPPPALIPPAMLLLGLGPAMCTAVIGFAACFPLLLAAMDAGRAVPPALVDTARSLGAGRLRLAFHVIVPACLPSLATGLRVALPVALIVAVLAEMVGGDGTGRLMLRLQRTWRIPELYACILGLGLTGFGLAATVSRLERRLLFWSPSRHHPGPPA